MQRHNQWGLPVKKVLVGNGKADETASAVEGSGKGGEKDGCGFDF